MICPKCNTANDSEYVFCVNCGTTLTTTADTSPSVATVFPQQVEGPPTFHPQPQQGRGRKLLIFGILGLAAILAVGAGLGVFFLMTSTSSVSTIGTMPDHLGLFAAKGNTLTELRKVEVADLTDVDKKLGQISTAGEDFVLYSDGNDIPLGELKLVRVDSIKPGGEITNFEFQAVPAEGNPAVKTLRFPGGLEPGKYAFALFNGYFDDGKHRLWPVEITGTVRAANADNSRTFTLPMKNTAGANSNNNAASPTPAPPVPKPTISAPVGSTVAFCNSSDVILRAAPGLDAKKMSMLKKGQKVFVIRYSDNTDMWNGVESNWAYIQTEAGKRGWVFTPFITK